MAVSAMQDIELAKAQLYSDQLTLVIVKDRQVLFRTDAHRISGLIHAIDALGITLKGSSLADRVAGKALALLCVYAGIQRVYAEVLSKKAQALFKENNVDCDWKLLVENVLDPSKTEVCPFERAAEGLSDPKTSYAVFKSLLQKMKSCE